jgi:hypothetical protein
MPTSGSYCNLDTIWILNPEAETMPSAPIEITEAISKRISTAADVMGYGACNPIMTTCHPSAVGVIVNWVW